MQGNQLFLLGELLFYKLEFTRHLKKPHTTSLTNTQHVNEQRRQKLNTPINISGQTTQRYRMKYTHKHATGAQTNKRSTTSQTSQQTQLHRATTMTPDDLGQDWMQCNDMQTLTTEQHSPLGKMTMCWRSATMTQLTM